VNNAFDTWMIEGVKAQLAVSGSGSATSDAVALHTPSIIQVSKALFTKETLFRRRNRRPYSGIPNEPARQRRRGGEYVDPLASVEGLKSLYHLPLVSRERVLEFSV